MKGIFKNNNFSTPIFHQSTPSLPLEHVNLIHPNQTLIQNNKIESILSELKKINVQNNNFIKRKVTNHVLPIGQRFIVVCDEETPLNFLSIISELFNKISSKSFEKQLLEEIEKEKHFVFIKYHKEKK